LKQRVVSIMKEVRMSKMRSVSSLAAGLGIMALACWFVTATFPLAAAPQMVADGPGVTVDAGGTVIHRSGILYPDGARRNRVQGVVTVEASVDSSGNVVDTRVLSGPIELRRAAQQSVLTWHFATDTSMSTRQVKVNFELSALPEESPLPPVPPAVPQMDLAGRPSSGQPANIRAGVIRGSLGPPSLEGKRLTHIVTAGMTDSARTDLLSRIPVHEGDILNADSLERVRRIVRDFDEHMNVGTGINANGEVTLMLSVPGAPSAGVIGGIVGGVPGGVPGGAVGGVLGGIMGGVPGGIPAVPPAADGTKRINIGGNVQQAKLISQERPVYPPLAKQSRISGVVHLAAVIGKEGNVIDLRVISGHPLLIPSAIGAVKNWVYQVTLLNGEPVEVSTQIDVNYTLSDDPV
jgi:TonB family protein